MEVWFAPLPPWFLAITMIGIITVLIARQFETSKGKDDQKKEILKELLEAYGLEIPSELKSSKKTIARQTERK